MANRESLLTIKMLLFSYHATHTIIISFLPLYLKYKGLNEIEIGWVLAIGPLASIFGQPFWGYMSDKFQTIKYILIICLIGLLTVGTIFFQMNTLIAILLMGAVFYFFTTPIAALSDSLAQRRTHELEIPFGTVRMWGSIGFATSSLIIGNILTKFGVQYMILPYLLFGAFALIVVFRLQDVKVSSDPIHFKDINLLVKNKPFVIFLLLVTFITVSHRTNDSFMALYIAELGGSEGLVGLAWFIGVTSEALIFAFAGFWFRKYHPLFFIIIAGALYTVRWFALSLIHDPSHLIMLQVLHGLSFGVFYLTAFNYVTRLIPKMLQSTGHLVFFAVIFGVSGIIGSLAGGVVMDHFGGSTLYFFNGCLALIGTICITIYHVFPYGKGTEKGQTSQLQ